MLKKHIDRKNWTGGRCGGGEWILARRAGGVVVGVAFKPLCAESAHGSAIHGPRGGQQHRSSIPARCHRHGERRRFPGDGSQLTNLPVSGTANVQISTTVGANTWTKPANAKQVYAYLIGGGGGARPSGGPSAAGGNGGLYAGGGGGGGASVNGQLSGKGGDGANGIAIIVTLF